MNLTIKERLDALEARIVQLKLPTPTRSVLMDAVKGIAIEQDRVTRHACAASVAELHAVLPKDRSTNTYTVALACLQAAERAVLHTPRTFFS
jgi:hypothetical protein